MNETSPKTSSSRRGPAIGLLAGLLLCVGACTMKGPSAPPSLPVSPLSSERIDAIVDSPDRSAADRTNDIRRMPRKMLAFIDIRPGTTALDVSAGGGYTTELLARSIGARGTVYGQSPPRDANRPAPKPAAPEDGSSAPVASAAAAPAPPASAPRTSATMLAERDARLRSAHIDAAPIIVVAQRFDDPVPAAVADQGLDLVTLMFNYHDLGFLGVDRDRMNRAIFRALKPGGVYVIADHAGRPGTGISESGTLHRIDESFLRNEVEAVGFRLKTEAAFLRNPSDPRDRNTPEPPQPKDEFVLKFVKP